MTQHAHLAEDLSSVAKARRFVHEALDGAPESVRGQAELPVSALATDALKYCGGFGLSVEQLDGQVRVQVCDGGAGRPVLREPSTFDRAGRDLQIVSPLSDDWGVEHAGPGKTGRFRLPLTPRGHERPQHDGQEVLPGSTEVCSNEVLAVRDHRGRWPTGGRSGARPSSERPATGVRAVPGH